jgi:hypothetical protein
MRPEPPILGIPDTQVPNLRIYCLSMRRIRGSATALIAIGGLLLASCGSTATAGWSTSSFSPPAELVAVSCATKSSCLGVSNYGPEVLWNGSGWSTQHVDMSGAHFSALSCPTPKFCLAVASKVRSRPKASGNLSGTTYYVTWNGAKWTHPVKIDGNGGIGSVSCASTSFCVATDEDGHALIWSGRRWTTTDVGTPDKQLASVSCTSTDFCVVIDGWGNAVSWNGSKWSTPVDIAAPDSANYGAVSCVSSTFCAAVDWSGNAQTWNGHSWSKGRNVDHGREIYSVSCATERFCVAFDTSGFEVKWIGHKWSYPTFVDPRKSVFSVSCPSPSFCVAGGSDSYALMYR